MSELGLKINQTRKQKGISQEKLSEDANINLRTLQRIESGETCPHGDTLKRISKALEIPLEELITYGLDENYGYIKTLHFSSLIFVFLPLGNILLPLIFWLTRRDKILNLSFFSKKLLNFQITWSILTYLPLIYFMLNFMTGGQMPIPIIILKYSWTLMLVFPLFMYLINFSYTLIVATLISNKRVNYFPIAIRFIK